uniref:Uncharacterized protein n=1 Tax=Caenorhabditis japonica TaxID=281687 RepID=A0A8R1HJ20_CAEJA
MAINKRITRHTNLNAPWLTEEQKYHVMKLKARWNPMNIRFPQYERERERARESKKKRLEEKVLEKTKKEEKWKIKGIRRSPRLSAPPESRNVSETAKCERK